ncbi:PREDICTED: putative leucine-rich repeat-containing protein DDB_G0290503 [Amphimedon queenslandica]|uniref:Uncharacterized protein n=1 Tax=Amphimedon queenslandica TaxID=400682 RepID=A0A1X7UGC4_AMPQE|nr:PREDICTED: putative leucine-rich repeat-containing protein DDB_G0290503 [Amphimedon queenslandica]|eukprot:XP_003388044.2 PREDICTED: putative leucine-rich repeat-containing protein DDB_G0290503 [Amphimedon queenslandica]
MTARPTSAPKVLQPVGGDESTAAASVSCCMRQELSLSRLHQSLQQLQESLVDKDYSIQSLNDEVSRLSVFEKESERKDKIISTLREEIAKLHKSNMEKCIKLNPVMEELKSIKILIQERDGEIDALQTTVSELNDKLSRSRQQAAALQTQLSHKNSLLATQSDELRTLKREKRQCDDHISSANEFSKEKQSTITSLNDKVKRLKTANQDLTQRVESTQLKYSQSIETEKLLRDEIQQLKGKSSQIKLQLSNTQDQLQTTKTTNNRINNELDKTKEQLEQLCHQLRGLVCLESSSKLSLSPDVIVSNVDSIIKEQVQLKKNHEQLEERHQEACERLASLQNDVKSVSRCLSNIQPLSPLPSVVSTIQSSVNDIHVSDEGVSLIVQCLTNLCSNVQSLQTNIEHINNALKTGMKSLLPDKPISDKSIDALIDCLLEVTRTNLSKNEAQQLQIVVLTEEKDAAIKEREARVRDECNIELRDRLGTLREEERIKREKEKDELVTKAREELKETNDQRLSEIKSLRQELKTKEKELETKCEEIKELKINFNDLTIANTNLINELGKLKASLHHEEKEHSDTLILIKTQNETREMDISRTLQEYKIQCQEHASTIVSLEGKLIGALEEGTRWKEREMNTQEKLKSLQNELELLQSSSESSQSKTNNILQVLRRQLVHANESSDKERERAREVELKMEEMKEKQKEEIDKLTSSHKDQISDLRSQLAQRESTLAELCQSATNKTPPTEPHPKKSPEKLTVEEDHTHLSKEEEEDTPPDVLVAVGHRCLGDNHQKVIDSQKHALHEMRRRIDELMRTHPPVPSHQAALKELAKLRQELIEMKTNEIMRKEEENRKGVESVAMEIGHVPSRTLSQYELELEEALQDSEDAYNNLLMFLSEKLHIPNMPDFKPLGGVNKVARQHILKERNEFIEGSLNEALTVVRARHKPVPVTSQTGQTSSERPKSASVPQPVPVPDLSPYGVYNNEVLERLDQEKRLQEAMAKRKEYKSSKQRHRRRSHSCMLTSEEVQHRMDQVRRLYSQKLDKKSAEIDHLKQELKSSQQENESFASKMKILRGK